MVGEANMKCSCGQPGTIKTRRREQFYCEACFLHHITQCIRREARTEPIVLKPQPSYFLTAVQAVCVAAGKPVILADKGQVAGCAETAAAAKIKHLFGHTTGQQFPESITLEELQTFFKAEAPVLDIITQELCSIDQKHPGTVNSINKTR